MRVSRALIALSAKGFFLAHHLSFDPKLLDQIAGGDKTRIAAATEANEQKTAAQTGVVYIQIANEKDRGVGEALRKDLPTKIKGTSDARPRHFDLRIGKNAFVEKH